MEEITWRNNINKSADTWTTLGGRTTSYTLPLVTIKYKKMNHNPCQTKKKKEKGKLKKESPLSLSRLIHPRLLLPSLFFAPRRWKFSSPFLWIWSSVTESLSSSSISSRMFSVTVLFVHSLSPFLTQSLHFISIRVAPQLKVCLFLFLLLQFLVLIVCI